MIAEMIVKMIGGGSPLASRLRLKKEAVELTQVLNLVEKEVRVGVMITVVAEIKDSTKGEIDATKRGNLSEQVTPQIGGRGLALMEGEEREFGPLEHLIEAAAVKEIAIVEIQSE